MEELTAQQLDEKLLGTDVPSVGLPVAPTTVPQQPVAAAAAAAPAESAEEAEFRKLAEEMSA